MPRTPVQFELLLTQNTHATATEFDEKYVLLQKGGLLSSDVAGVPTVLPGIATGTGTHRLVNDATAASGLKWEAVPVLTQLHTQNTDTGTTNATFDIDSDGGAGVGVKLKAAAGVLKFRNLADTTDADITAKDGNFSGNVFDDGNDPTASNQLTNKQYVDSRLAANDAMVFKGSIGTAGTLTGATFTALATYNAGDTYKIITARTYVSKDGTSFVCELGDLMIATADRAGSGWVAGDWIAIQTTGEAVIGPGSSTTDNLATFNGETGKVIKDSGIAVSSIATAQTTANNAIPKATFTATGNELIVGSAASTFAALAITASTFVGRKATGNVAAMSAAEARAILNVADGAVNVVKATGAEIDTGTDDAKFATPKAIADSTIVKGAGTVVGDTLAAFNGTTGKLLKASGLAISKVLKLVTAPVLKTSTGSEGEVAIDGNFMYFYHVGSSSWKRSPIATNWVV